MFIRNIEHNHDIATLSAIWYKLNINYNLDGIEYVHSSHSAHLIFKSMVTHDSNETYVNCNPHKNTKRIFGIYQRVAKHTHTVLFQIERILSVSSIPGICMTSSNHLVFGF